MHISSFFHYRFLILFLISGSVKIAIGQTSVIEKIWPDVFETTKSSVVQVIAYGNDYDWFQPFKKGDVIASRGTGFIASPQGDIYTNFHVIDGKNLFYIQHSDVWKEQFELEFIGGSSEYDWAHLRIKSEDLERLNITLENKLTHLNLGDSDTLCHGQEIMLLGYPLGEENIKHAIGTISGQQQTNFGDCFTTSAPSYQGCSGGPCIDKNGNVIGILVGGIQNTENMGFVIPINRLKVILDELVNGAIVHESFWGLKLSSTTPATFSYLNLPYNAGAYVAKVDKESLAEQAGVCAGDVISAINGFVLDRFCYAKVPWTKYKMYYLDVLARIKNGELVTFTLYRNGEQITCSVIKNTNSPFKIKYYHLPFEKEPFFDVFGGIVFTELTLNHYQEILPGLHRLLDQGVYLQAIKFLEHDNRHKPQILVSYIFPESEVAKCGAIRGDNIIITTINGRKVNSIDEFHQAVLDYAYTHYMVIQLDNGAIVTIKLNDAINQEPAMAKKYGYQLSPLYEKLKTIQK